MSYFPGAIPSGSSGSGGGAGGSSSTFIWNHGVADPSGNVYADWDSLYADLIARPATTPATVYLWPTEVNGGYFAFPEGGPYELAGVSLEGMVTNWFIGYEWMSKIYLNADELTVFGSFPRRLTNLWLTRSGSPPPIYTMGTEGLDLTLDNTVLTTGNWIHFPDEANGVGKLTLLNSSDFGYMAVTGHATTSFQLDIVVVAGAMLSSLNVAAIGGLVVRISSGGGIWVDNATVNLGGVLNDTQDSMFQPFTVTPVLTASQSVATNSIVLCDPTAGGFTVTLPGSYAGQEVTVQNVSTSTNQILINGSDGGAINGGASTTITTSRGRLRFIGTGTTWISG